MNLRKIFNIPNGDQRKLIDADYERLKKLADEKADRKNQQQYDYQESYDNKCPNCKATNIVNKITRTQGSGEVSGSFSLGFGSVSGSSSTDTNGVNHCNSCGNQWKKYKVSYKWASDIMEEWVRNLRDDAEGSDWDWGAETRQLLMKEGFYAETLKRMVNKNSCYDSDILTLNHLRIHYKSVYDK